MDTKENQQIQSIDRALNILEVLATQRDGLGITAIAKRTGLSKSTVHRILISLALRGYVEHETTSSNYRLGLKYIEIASYYINSLELQTEARPFLWDLTSELGLTAHLGILDAHEVVYVEKLDVFPGVRLYSQIGYRVPAYCSSLGKCLLSGLSSDDLEAAMTHCSFERFTDKTITNLRDLKKNLRLVRERGWALDDEEHDIGHRCIGAPIFDYRGDVVAAVSASGPITVLSDDRINQVVDKVRNSAMKISQRMGYVP
jgi:IclR family transcriptional regulator, KDG regulon repressor